VTTRLAGRPARGRASAGDVRRVVLTPHGRVVRWRVWSVRFDVRSVVVVGVLVAAAAAAGVVALGSGDSPIAVRDVLRALAGDATGNVHMIVVDWRLPRVLLALMLGAALGVAGAIFQSLSRNPLGSPDIIGFNTGAATGALLVILVFEGGYFERAAGSLLGGVATALVVYLLAFKRGVQGFRLVLVGIAVSSMLSSVNAYLILHADITQAMAAATWQVGSLNGLGWEQARPVAVVLVVLVPLAVVLARPMRMMEMGDDAARSLGVNAEPVRLALLVTGVGLTAVATAAAGPISFVALAAPQLAHRVTRSAGLAVVPAAAMGALLLVVSDWAAQRVFAPTQLPVGVMTVCIGGGYLVWLLARERKRGRG
jgi:iron complex transport system permease protein